MRKWMAAILGVLAIVVLGAAGAVLATAPVSLANPAETELQG
jgi:hypothetical protein